MKNLNLKPKLSILIIIAGFIFCSGSLMASDSLSIIVRAKCGNDGKVKIRWAPKNYDSWRLGLVTGYKIEAYILKDSHGELEPDSMINTRFTVNDKVIVADTSFWQSFLDTSQNNYAGLAAGTMFSDSFSIGISDTNSLAQFRQLESDKDNRYGMAILSAEMDFNTAIYSGLGMLSDTSVFKPGFEYMIVVSFSDSAAAAISISGICELKTVYKLDPKPKMKYAGGKDKIMTIFWAGSNSTYLAYEVQRASGNYQFTKISDIPVLGQSINSINPDFAQFADSVADNKISYYYKVRGQNSFGDFGPWSDTISGYTIPSPIKIYPTLDSVININNTSMRMYWKFPQESLGDILGFNVYKSEKIDGTYEQMNNDTLSVNTYTYLDSSPSSSTYYKVEAIDSEGNKVGSFSVLGQLLDTVPPSKPHTPTGTISKQGKVALQWQASTETDLSGYRIYSSNTLTGEYTQVTDKVTANASYSYDMDIKNLNKHSYARIRAIDNRGNQSEYSNPVQLDIPDIVPPSPAVIVKAYAQAGANTLDWTASSSLDVSKYIIKRREKGHLDWTAIKTYTSASNIQTHNDSSAEKSTAYEYVVAAIDNAGNISHSGLASILTSLPVRSNVQSLIVSQISGTTVLSLSWSYYVEDGIKSFKIYRAKDSYPYKQYAVIEAQDATLTNIQDVIDDGGGHVTFLNKDPNVTKTHTYKYKAIAVFKDGTVSDFSNESSITVN